MAQNINPTLFPEEVGKYFLPMLEALRAENAKEENKTRIFQRLLEPKMTATLDWTSSDITGKIGMADVVAMNSTIPLKQRRAVALAKGDIPKLAASVRFEESDLKRLFGLASTPGVGGEQLAKEVLSTTPEVVRAILDRIEAMTLQMLSEGQILVADDKTQGLGVRADFGIPEGNRAKVTNKWSTAKATPVTDIRTTLTKAEEAGNEIQAIILDRSAFNKLRASQEGKELVAGFRGTPVGGAGSPSQTIDALKDEFGVEFIVIARNAFTQEQADGTRVAVKPWKEGAVAFLPSATKVGTLYHSPLVEESRPVAGVTQGKANEYTLVQQYSETDPYSEKTMATAFVFPVLNNATKVYLLDTEVVG